MWRSLRLVLVPQRLLLTASIYRGIHSTSFHRASAKQGREQLFINSAKSGNALDGQLDSLPETAGFRTLSHKLKRGPSISAVINCLSRWKSKGLVADAATASHLIWSYSRARIPADNINLLYNELLSHLPEPTEIMDIVVLNALAHEGKSTELLRHFELIRHRRKIVPIRAYTALIFGLCRAGRIPEALDLLQSMRVRGPMPDVVTYGALLKALGDRAETNDLVDKVLAWMQTDRIPPSPYVYTILTDYFAARGRIDDARSVLDHLRRHCLDRITALESQARADVASLGTAAPNSAGSYGSVGGDSVGDMQLVPPGQQQSTGHGAAARRAREVEVKDMMRSLTVGYNIMMKAHVRAGDTEGARGVWAEMQAYAIPPDEVTYGTLINGLCKRGDVHDAQRLLRAMEDGGSILASAITYTTVIRALAEQGETTEAMAVLRSMRKQRAFPTVVTYNTLIHMFAQRSNVRAAENLYQAMLHDGVRPNVHTFSALIEGHTRADDLHAAEHVFHHVMREHNVTPSLVVCNIMINAYAKSGDMQAARDVIALMRDRFHLLPDLQTFNSLLNAYAASGNIDAATRVLDEMAAASVAPDELTLGLMCKAIVHTRSVHAAHEQLPALLARLRAHTPLLQPGVYTLTLLLNEWCNVCNVERIEATLQEMRRYGVEISEALYARALHCYEQAGVTHKVTETLRQMEAEGVKPGERCEAVLGRRHRLDDDDDD